MKETTITVGPGTAFVIVAAVVGGAVTVLLAMSSMVTNVTRYVSDIHQRVNNIQGYTLEQADAWDDAMDNLTDLVNDQLELSQITTEYQEQLIASLEEVNGILSERIESQQGVVCEAD